MTDYPAYRTHVGIGNLDMTAALSNVFPKYNKVVAVSVNHPDTHGVCLLPEAEQILVTTFGEGPGLAHYKYLKKRKADKRRKTHRITFRMDDEMQAKADILKEAAGAFSWQELFEIMLKEAYRRWEEE